MNPASTEGPAGHPSRDALWLALIIAAGVALRAAAIAGFQHSPESDELAYRSMALSLVKGDGIVDGMGNRAMYNVGYPLFVLAPVFFFLGENLLAARLVNLVLGAAAVALTYMVAKEAGAGRLGRLLAAAIWALYLPASVYGVYLFKENLMTPLMLGVVWCALRLIKERSYRAALACGALLGLLALTGNAALCLLGPVAVALLCTPAPVRQRSALFASMLAAAIVVAAPWMVRNLRAIGAPVLNTNGGFNLYLGNNPAATGFFMSIGDTPRGPTWQALRKTGEVQASETLKAEAIAWIREHPGEFLSLALRKAAYFWTPPFHEGKGQASTAETAVRIMWAIQFLALIAAALGSLFFASLRNRTLAVLWLAIACYTAVHMLFYVIFRYREPIMPLLGVIAALAIEALLHDRRWVERRP
jgi:4-amino-4-deoxy-L-arabinose transferase-like glycosyltransferase